MSAPVLDLGALATHLRAALVPDPLLSVTLLGDEMPDARNRRARTTPTLAVVPERRDVTQEQGGLAECERAVEQVLLVLQLRHAGPGSDDEGYPALHQLWHAVYAALAGVVVQSGWQGAEYRGGRLLSMDQDRFSWAERYRFTRL